MSAHFQCVRLQVGVYLCVWHFCAPPFKMRGFMFWNSTVRNLGLMEQLDAILNSRRMPISPYVSVDTKRVIYDIVLGNDDTGWRLCSYTGLLVFMPEVISIHTMFSCTEKPWKKYASFLLVRFSSHKPECIFAQHSAGVNLLFLNVVLWVLPGAVGVKQLIYNTELFEIP